MKSTEFESHKIFDKLDQTISRISNIETRYKIPIDKLNYYETACKYIKDRLKITIPILVAVDELNTIFQELDNALVQINNFIGNGNFGHLTNADNHFNIAITRIRNLPFPLVKSDFNFAKSIANFESIVKSKYEVVEKENSFLKDELKKIKVDLLAKNNDIKKISDTLFTKNNEISNLASTFQTEFANLKSVINQNIDSDRKIFRSEITTDRENYSDEIALDKEKFKKELDEKILILDRETNSLISTISTKLEEAQRIVSVIGNIGVTGNYQIIANQNKKAANTWRILAIIFMTIFSGLLIWTIWDVSSENYDWIKSVIRIIAAAALSYPATYAARESSKHRKIETTNRKLELELASLTPFIEMLPEEKKREIKANLVEKYFGNHIEILEENNAKDEELSLGGFEKILKAILPILRK